MKYNISVEDGSIIKIGSHNYTVRLLDEDEDPRLGSDWGAYVSCEQLILINKNQSDTMMVVTLFHEVIHVFEDLYNIKISHDNLNRMAQLFFDFLTQNFLDTKE